MRERGELVECGCVNPIACGDCKGTGIVRIKRDKTIDSPLNQAGVAELASSSTRKGAYL